MNITISNLCYVQHCDKPSEAKPLMANDSGVQAFPFYVQQALEKCPGTFEIYNQNKYYDHAQDYIREVGGGSQVEIYAVRWTSPSLEIMRSPIFKYAPPPEATVEIYVRFQGIQNWQPRIYNCVCSCTISLLSVDYKDADAYLRSKAAQRFKSAHTTTVSSG